MRFWDLDLVSLLRDLDDGSTSMTSRFCVIALRDIARLHVALGRVAGYGRSLRFRAFRATATDA